MRISSKRILTAIALAFVAIGAAAAGAQNSPAAAANPALDFPMCCTARLLHEYMPRPGGASTRTWR